MSDTPTPKIKTPKKEEIAEEVVDVAEAATASATKAFDSFSMPEPVRNMAELGMTRARETYETCKTIANDSSAMVETTFDAISRNSAEINKSAIHAAKASVADGFDHLEALMGTRTLAEFIELQTKFAKRQFEGMTDQAKAFQGKIGKAIEDTVSPARENLNKTMASVKSAF
ncbi:MAG: phasin family protein [Rhodobiaceae bacterium]|nr:phasin family protein [Rhodobiaceae bacterium]MCC0054910.1 phasin family protein [Rhodobiaceae bacterium]